MTGSGLGTFGSQAGVGDRLLTNGPRELRVPTNGVSGWAIIRFWQHSTANHSGHSSRFTGPPLTATEEWKDAGRERTLSFPSSLLAGRSCCCSAAGGSSCCCRLERRGFIPDKYRSFGDGCEWNAAGADMASVRHEYAPVPDPGACVKSRRCPLLSGVVCRWGRLGHGRR